jgi:hypothetical protein
VRPRGRPARFLLVGLLLILPGSATAQPITLAPWQGELEGTIEYDEEESKTKGSPRERFESTTAQEILTIRNPAIHILDPRLFTLSIEGSFGLFQERLTESSGGVGDFRHGTLWGYDLLAQVLPGEPLALRLFANRTQTHLPLARPGASELESESRGATLEARGLPVPSTFTARQELLREESRVEGVVGRRDEVRTIVTYEGQRGFQDAELDLRYEFLDLDDRIFPGLSYRSHEGVFGHSLDFGPDGTWRWDSRLRGYTRQGGVFGGAASTDLTTYLVDEGMTIDHSETLQTRYRYLFVSTDTVGGRADTHTGTVSVRHQLYQSLLTLGTAEGTHQELEQGAKDVGSGRLDLVYTKRLPGGGRLRAGVGGFLAYEEDRFREAQAFVPQETHAVAAPFALPIRLRTAFVDESSITVTKIALGPRPVGCLPTPGPPIPLVAGQDFTVRTVGAITEIVPVPCSTTAVGINPGDTIAVDYRFAVSPDLAFVTIGGRVDIDVDYGWVRVYAAYDSSDQERVSGSAGQFLDDQRIATMGAEVRYDGERLTASALGEVRRYDSTHLAYDTLRFNELVTIALWDRDLTLSLLADQTLDEYRSQNRTSRRVSGRAMLTYLLGTGLTAEATVGAQYLDDSLFPTEEVREAGLRVRWRVRQLEINPSVFYYDRRRGDVETSELRAMLQVIRRF